MPRLKIIYTFIKKSGFIERQLIHLRLVRIILTVNHSDVVPNLFETYYDFALFGIIIIRFFTADCQRHEQKRQQSKTDFFIICNTTAKLPLFDGIAKNPALDATEKTYSGV